MAAAISSAPIPKASSGRSAPTGRGPERRDEQPTDRAGTEGGAGLRLAGHARRVQGGQETGGRYSVSEWWVEPGSSGPGPHSHVEEDELFFVIGGTMSVLVGNEWHNLASGGFVRSPAGTTHDFENRTDRPAGVLNVFMGAFEHRMPAIVKWYEDNPAPSPRQR